MVSRHFLNDSIDFPLLSLFILFFFSSGQSYKDEGTQLSAFYFCTLRQNLPSFNFHFTVMSGI